jgi:hypothetical protein
MLAHPCQVVVFTLDKKGQRLADQAAQKATRRTTQITARGVGD